MPVSIFRAGLRSVFVCAVLGLTGCSSLSPPVSEPQVAGFAMRLTDQLSSSPNSIVGTLTADRAVEQAMLYNYSIRAKELEVALSQAKVRVQGGAMLPSLVAESNYYRLDRQSMTRSSGSSIYSTSTDLGTVSRDITLSWNIVDFGLAYVRSKQALDKTYQAQEEARRIRARIAEEARSAFWRAVALRKLAPALHRLDHEVDESLALARLAARDPEVDPMVSVTLQRDTLNLQRELNQLHVALAGANDQLKELLGHPLDKDLNLATDRPQRSRAQPVEMPDADIAIALKQRPEIRQHMYDLRITEDEVNATFLQMLPGATFSRGFSTDSNSYLLNPHWVHWGARVAGDLIRLARLPGELDAIESQAQVHRQNALATGAAIVMQVHVARARLAIQIRTYRDANRFAHAQRQLVRQVQAALDAGRIARQALVREKLATLLADIRALVAFADLEAAQAAYATARGDDPVRIIEPVAPLPHLQLAASSAK